MVYKVTSDHGWLTNRFSVASTDSGMNNTTLPQESDTALDSPGFMAYSILLTMIALVAVVVMGVTAIALVTVRSIAQPLWLILINLLLAGLVMGLCVVFIVGTSVALVAVGPEQPRPPLYLCRVYLLMASTAVVVRQWSLAAFALSVLAIVRFGKKTISLLNAAVVIAILWLVPIAINLYIVLPYVYEVQFVDGVACFPDSNAIIIPASGGLLVIWFTVGGLIPITVSIAVPIICLCYIKKNTVTQDTQYRKAMAKFSLFLILGSVINIAGQLIPGAISLNSEGPAVYLSYGFATTSLIPTPIIIIAFLKPVQEQLKKMFTKAIFGLSTKRAMDSKATRCATNNEVEDGI